MRFVFSILFITISFALPTAAQSRVKLQDFFEGKQVTVRIDMPSADGVDVYPRTLSISCLQRIQRAQVAILVTPLSQTWPGSWADRRHNPCAPQCDKPVAEVG